MPTRVLRCRDCNRAFPALAGVVCVRCFGALEPLGASRGPDRAVAPVGGGPRTLQPLEQVVS